MKNKLIVSSLLMLFFAALLQNAHAAESPSTINGFPEIGEWLADVPAITSPDQVRYIFGYHENRDLMADTSLIIEDKEKNRSFYIASLAPCQFAGQKATFRACIEGVYSRPIGSQNWEKAELSAQTTTTIRTSPSETNKVTYGAFKDSEADFRPQGFDSTIWNLPNAKHGDSTSYLLRTRFSGDGCARGQGSSVDGGCVNGLTIDLLPLTNQINTKSVAAADLKYAPFPKGIEYSVKLDLGVFIKAISGWFFNRIDNPEIYRWDPWSNPLDVDKPVGILQISGAPSVIPIGITDAFTTTAIPNSFRTKVCKSEPTACTQAGIAFGKAIVITTGDGSSILDPSPTLLSELEAIPGGVKTLGYQSRWSSKTAWLEQLTGVNADALSCLTKGRFFLGSVSSNATLFQTTPPVWDPATQSFAFQVAAPHSDPKGNLNTGNYTMHIPMAQAKCRWGEDVANAKVQISVVSANGDTKVTTVSSIIENGMLKFVVSGITYSSPVIKIKLIQGEIPVKKSPVKVVAKIKTITCTKAKNNRKISALKPKCPTGWTLKK
ncbi:unannotated protein [freshwater metagenome]|uniref:Unannotated protein n=1 Tax=freshwater metagenome TaxID=449393 RepID=A0A6J7UEB6_9ZZZZ|nr:hypothetical protein [Actinomycetota bacterium]